jgi:hypothetical protein
MASLRDERWEMRDRKHGRLKEKKTNFTQMLKGNIKALPVIFTFPSRWETRDKESMGAVNEGTLQCESIQRLNGRGEGSCVKGKEMIKVCYGCWLMGGRGGPRLVYYFFFSFLNQTKPVRLVGRFRHTKTGNRTGPNIFLNTLTGSIGFFYRFGFFG